MVLTRARRRLLGIGVLLSVTAVALAVNRLSAPSTSSTREGPRATPSMPSWVTTPTLQPCPAGAPAARAKLPAVTLDCLGSGPALALDHLPSRPHVINLWASWCSPCRREAPRLAAAAAATGGRVGFLGVDTQDERGSALDFLHHVGLDYPQLADPDAAVLHRLSAPGLPVTIAVDASGRIVYRRIGEISAAQLNAALHAADPTLPSTSGGGS